MQRDPVFSQPRRLIDVTTVTIQSRYLMRPSPELNDLVLGVMGRAQTKYGIKVLVS